MAQQGRRAQQRQPRMITDGANQSTLALFTGTVKLIDKHVVRLELEDTNLVDLRRTRKTQFWSGDTAVKPESVTIGVQASVEAARAPDGSLEAVHVRLRPATSKPQ